MGKFDDIIYHKYAKSPTRKHMTMVERAAQFGAFRAVTGHTDALDETARLTDAKIELDEYKKAELNEKLRIICDFSITQEISVTYFIPDEKKSGGAYLTKTGSLKKIRLYEKDIVMEDGTQIPIDNIFAIESDIFESFNSTLYNKGM